MTPNLELVCYNYNCVGSAESTWLIYILGFDFILCQVAKFALSKISSLRLREEKLVQRQSIWILQTKRPKLNFFIMNFYTCGGRLPYLE